MTRRLFLNQNHNRFFVALVVTTPSPRLPVRVMLINGQIPN